MSFFPKEWPPKGIIARVALQVFNNVGKGARLSTPSRQYSRVCVSVCVNLSLCEGMCFGTRLIRTVDIDDLLLHRRISYNLLNKLE